MQNVDLDLVALVEYATNFLEEEPLHTLVQMVLLRRWFQQIVDGVHEPAKRSQEWGRCCETRMQESGPVGCSQLRDDGAHVDGPAQLMLLEGFDDTLCVGGSQSILGLGVCVGGQGGRKEVYHEPATGFDIMSRPVYRALGCY